MAGLLDTFFGNADQTRALGLLGSQMMAGNAPQGFLAANEYLADAPARKMKQTLAELQMQEAQQRMQDEQRKRQFMQTMPDLSGGIPADLMSRAVQSGAIGLGDYLNSARKDTTPLTVAPGASLVDRKTMKPIFTAPKETALPAGIQEYQFAQNQGYRGTFEQWDRDRKKAGASNVQVRVDNKMGESLAGQVGPMVKDSRVQTDGAVKMFDAADRIERALNSNKVLAGPMASQVQTVRQLAQVIGGGNDEGIRQTRQVIKSLAQMAVEARKQLQGQGQVTENEAAAVAKADAGDINDLTVGELRDLVTLTKRASHYTAKGHSEILKQLQSNQGTAGLVPFYQVQRMDELLKHQPALPQIGSQPSVDDLVKKYGGGR
jgi:hypothetical protein